MLLKLRDDWFEAERLHRAAAEGDIEAVTTLIAERVPLNEFDDIGHTPLHYAAKHSRLEVADLLLSAGAQINARDEETNWDTPIAVAARDASAEMVALLLDRGADPSIQRWMAMDANDQAAQRRDESKKRIVELLAGYCSGPDDRGITDRSTPTRRKRRAG